MDRETLIATATATYTATAGTSAEKLRAAIRDLVGVLRANDVVLVTDRGTQFVATLTAPLDAIPGRPAYPDALAFAASMETMILAAKGTANDPDSKTTPQLVAASRALAVTIPGLIDAGAPAPVLQAVVRLSALATVIQARLV